MVDGTEQKIKIGVIYNLKLERNTLIKTQECMEYLTTKLEFQNLTDEEYDLFNEHMESIIIHIDKINKRIDYYENIKENNNG